MADNTVVIKIDVRADTAQIDRVKRKLAALRGESELLSDEFGDTADEADNLDDSLINVNKSSKSTGGSFRNLSRDSEKLEKRMSKLDKIAQGFGKFLQGVMKTGMKLLLLNLTGVAASLLAVNAAFAVGRFAVQAWHASLTVASAAGASFVAVLSALAAGQREWNASLLAYQYQYTTSLKAGTQQAQGQLRGFTSNVRLAVLGAEALNGAFSAISRNTQVNATIQSAMTAMGDFAASAADPSKAFVAAGEFIGQLSKAGKLDEDITKLADEVGPKFAEAIADSVKKGKTSSSDIMQALIGGDLAAGVGVQDQLEAINGTLFGTAKRNFQLIKEEFADLGQAFLPEFTAATERIGQIVRRFMMSISGSIKWFAGGNMVDGIVGAIDKLATWSAQLFNKYLPRTEGMIETIKNWGNAVSEGWGKMTDALRPLLDGARVLMDAFGPLFKSIFTEFGGGVRDFGQLLEDNRDNFMDFGDAALKTFMAISDLFGQMKAALVQVLPALTAILDIFTDIVAAVSKMMGFFNSGGALGSLAGLGVLLGGYFGLGQLGKTGSKRGKGALGSLMGKGAAGAAGTYTINAAAVYINGPLTPGGTAGGVGKVFGKAGEGEKLTWRDRAANAKQRAGQAWQGIQPMVSGMLISGGAYGLASSRSEEQSTLSGAATGAGIGLMMGGPVGGLVGGALGAVGGYLLGGQAEKKSFREKAKAAAGEYMTTVATEIDTALNSGDFQTATGLLNRGRGSQLESALAAFNSGGDLESPEWFANMEKVRDQYQLTAEELQQLHTNGDNYVQQLKLQEQALFDDLMPGMVKWKENMDNLSAATGLTNDEINRLATSMDIDLTGDLESSVAFFEEAFGVTIPQTLDELANAASNAFMDALDLATNPIIQQQKKAEAVDQSGQLLSESATAGTIDKVQVAQFVRDLADFEYTKTFDPSTGTYDANKALETMLKLVGTGGEAYKTGNVLEGQEGIIGPMVQPILDQISASFQNTYGKQLEGMIAQQTYDKYGATVDSSGQMTGYNGENIASLESAARSITNAPAAMSTAMSGSIPQISSGMSAAVTSALAAANIRVNVNVTGQIAGAQTTVTTDSSGGGGPNVGKPHNQDGVKRGDTMTSRLNTLMGKHQAINSRIAGRRNVTSTFRTDGLGSLNSDHLTGHAYDLVGDNLGAYKAAVEKQGGFAELHGRGESRHLHVAQGDTATPFIGPSMGGGGDNIVFHIGASENATPEQIAAAVMRKIDQRDRDRKERR